MAEYGDQPCEVWPKVFVGNLKHSKNEPMLIKLDVTHIVAVGDFDESFPFNFEYLIFEDVLDTEDSNIMKYFDKCAPFIEEGKEIGGVLIHCNAGVSRAPTIAAAYVMRKKRCTAEEAIEFVKSKCPPAHPNPGFVKQLTQYHKKLSERWKKQNPTPAPVATDNTATETETKSETTSAQTSTVNTTTDEANNTANNNTTANETSAPAPEEIIEKTIPATKYYTCRVCRTRLFDDTEMVDHVPGEGQQSFDWNKRAKHTAEIVACTAYFLEEKEWMGDLSSLDGKIQCPKCASRVGSYRWDGFQCSCGSWVVPAFQLLKSRVDEKVINQPLASIAAVSLPPTSDTTTNYVNNVNTVSEATTAVSQVTLQAK